MKTKIVYGITIIVCLVIGFLAGYYTTTPPTQPQSAAQDLLTTIMQRGYIIAGTSADYPPWEFMSNATHQITGLDVDIVNAIAQQLNVTVHWQDMDFDGLIAACKGGQVDILAASMGLTISRMSQLDYSIPYYHTDDILVGRANSTFTIGNLTDIGKYHLQVGVQPGTNLEDDLNGYVSAGYISQSQIHEYPRVDLMILDLVSGRIDVAYIETGPAQAFAKIYPIKTLYVNPIHNSAGDVIYFAKGQPALRDAINEAIATMEMNGTLQTLIVKWLGNGTSPG
jgi:ABC-type amino acid transport substrate-binding protein